MPYSLNIHIEAWPLAGAFRISRGTRKVSDVLMVEVNDGNYVGRGECFPYARYGGRYRKCSKTVEFRSVRN